MNTRECTRTVNLRNVEYLIQEAFTGIWRNGLMAFASISTIALSLGVLGAFVLASMSANNFANAQVGKFQVAVFMEREATDAQASDVVERIKKMDGVGDVALRSRDEEWANFKHQRPNFESAGLPLNPLPYSMDVKVSDKTRTAVIASKIRTMAGVAKVSDGGTTLSHMMAMTHMVKIVSVVGVMILLVTAVFIISNAIKLTLYARRREIRIMQLVGATNWFIRIPLVIEGVAFGIAGALIAWGLLSVGTIYLAQSARKMATLLAQFNSGVGAAELGISLILIGAMIGAMGSFVSIRRFLHDQ